MQFASSDGLVWEMGKIKLRRPDGKEDPVHLYQGSRKLAHRLTEALAAVPAANAALRGAADHCVQLLTDMDTYMDLMRPMRSGTRGADGCIEFKKSVLRTNEPAPKSTASILVVSYQ